MLRNLRLPPKTKLLAIPFIPRSYCFYYIAPTPIILSIGSKIQLPMEGKVRPKLCGSCSHIIAASACLS